MKLISWNVNGIRACLNKGFEESFHKLNADIFALQETKAQPEQIELEFEGYHKYVNSAKKKGYSGVAVFTKIEPLAVTKGIGIEEHDQEGRVLTLEYPDFYFVACYTPNSKRELARLDYRMEWEDAFLAYLDHLKEKKSVILCGDLNVAHEEIDLKNPKTNHKNAGFSDEERAKMTELLSHGYIDTYRYFYPDQEGVYSWWSYMFKAREKNAGWRIDYFIVSDDLKDQLVDAYIYTDIMGSDHCPVGLEGEFVMKFMMISDIHGDYSALKRVLDVYDQGDFDKLVILGDILYHGPRNDLPEGYAPKKCIPLLNAHKNDIIAVRGNCDAEVDQMVLEFPMRADYLEMFVDGHRFYLTHGHLYNDTNFPHLNAGDVYCFGHFHIPLLEKENNYYKVNPNSISLPKKGVQSYIVYNDETLSLYDLNHQLIDSLNITKG